MPFPQVRGGKRAGGVRFASIERTDHLTSRVTVRRLDRGLRSDLGTRTVLWRLRGVMDPAQDEARRWVRRKRIFYTIIIVYAALVALWIVIDILTGTDDWWFYWPTLGAGVIVAIIGISMFGVHGLFGADWERRQMERYRAQHRDRDDEGMGSG